MAYEIINKLRAPSTVRVVDGSATINLSDLSANTNTENVETAIVTSVKWSVHPTNGNLQISRGGVVVMNVFQSGFWSHDELNIANNASSNLTIAITGTGSCIVGVKKTASYNVDTQKL